MTEKIEEGVMGGMIAMPAINRIMQLAGLEHSGATETEIDESVLAEDLTSGMMSSVIQQAENLAQFKGNAEAAKLYAAGGMLSAVGKMLKDTELQSVEAQSKKKEIDAIAAFGADLIRTAQQLGSKTK